MNLRWVIGITAGIFGAGILVGYAARKRGIPPEEVPRWSMKEATRMALHAYDAAVDCLPDDEPVRLAEAIQMPSPVHPRMARMAKEAAV